MGRQYDGRRKREDERTKGKNRERKRGVEDKRRKIKGKGKL